MKRLILLLTCALAVLGATANVQLNADRVLPIDRSLMGDMTQNNTHNKGIDPYVINEIPFL